MMGAQLTQGEALIASFQSLMGCASPVVSKTVAQVSERSGQMEFDGLPTPLKNYLSVATGNGNLANPKLARLFSGDTSDYGNDPSKADAALVRKLKDDGFSADDCDMAMRASGLMRDKWDSPRGSSTYGKVTIERVFSGADKHHSSKTWQTASVETVKLPRLSSADGLIQFSDNPPPPRDFTIEDIMLMAKACLLAGFGGVSKTQWIMHATVCIALGLPFMGKRTVSGAVLLLLGEEDQAEIARRFNAIAKFLKLTEEQVSLVRQRVRAFPMVGLETRLTSVAGGSLESTGFASEIMAAAKQLEADCGLAVRLIGLDHAGLIHGGEFNAREDVVQTMRQVNYIAQESGAAVLVLAHSPKAAAGAEKSTAGAVAGSTAWVDHARAALVLRTMNDEEGKRYGIAPDDRNVYASLTVVKNNYGPTGGEFWLRRETATAYGVGVLRHVELAEPEKAPKGSNSKLRVDIFELVREKPCLTKNAVEGYAGAKDGRIRGSKAIVRSEVDMMLVEGILSFRQPTEEERKRIGIRGKTDGFLCTVVAAGSSANSTNKAAKNA